MPSINLNHEYPEINQADANALAIGALNGVLKSDGANGFSVVPVDAAPTASSTNLVESGGVKAAIDAAVQNATPKRTASNDPSSSSFSVFCDTALAGQAKPKLYGKSVAINQLAEHGNFDDISGLSNYGVSLSAANNVLTMTALSSIGAASGIAFPATIISGRKYYVAVTANFSKASSYAFLLGSWSGNTGISTGSTRIEYIGVAGADGNAIRFGINKTTQLAENDTVTAQNFMLIDLTAIGFTSAETASVSALKTAWLAKFGYPLPAYIPYNAGSIVSNNATYQMRGRNLWDEQWESGNISDTTGEKIASTSHIRNEYDIPVAPQTTYYCKIGNAAGCYVYFYDANGAFIGRAYNGGYNVANKTFTTPEQCRYIRFVNTQSSYLNDICINLSDASFNGQYEAYYSGGSVTADNLNGIGTALDSQDAEGQIVRKIGSVDLGTLTWTNASGNLYYSNNISSLKTDTKNILCDSFVPNKTATAGSELAAGEIAVFGNRAYINNATQTGTLYYELATPTTDTTSAADLSTQAGYNSLDPVAGDVQSADAECEYPVDVIAYIDKKLAEL